MGGYYLKRDDVREKIKDVIGLYESGFNSREIAVKYKITHSVILKLLNTNGVKMKAPHKRKGIEPWNKGKEYLAITGSKNPRWKGGITNLNQKIRHLLKYKLWLQAIFKRDNWTCMICKKRGGNLEADHYPKKFSEILKENNIKSSEDAKRCDILWSLSNGRTLCLRCHNRTKQVRSRFKKVGVTT